MKRLFLVLGLLVGISQAQTTTTITGTIRDLTQALVTSGKVTFTLQPSRDTTISGLARFSPAQVVCLINASGLIKAQDGTSVCTLTMNTALNPPGTYYRVDVWPFNVKTSSFTFYAVLSTYDWSTVVPTPTTSPAQNFVDIFSNQTIGGNKTFTGNLTLQGTVLSMTVSGAFTAQALAAFQQGFTVGAVGTLPTITEDAASCCVGYANISTGLHLHGSLSIDQGTINLGTGVNSIATGMSFQDGGFNIVVQPGPRGKEAFPITAASVTSNVLTITGAQLSAFSPGDVVFLSGLTESFLNGQTVTVSTSNGTNSFTAAFTHANFSNVSESQGLAETNVIKANGTLVLPDVALGTATPNSGYVLGMTGVDFQNNAGNCSFIGGATSGVLQNSGFGCNTNLVFPVNTRQVQWLNGGNSVSLTAAAATGVRTITLPDASGTLALSIASGTAVMTTAAITAGACGTTVTVAASGVATTDAISHSFNAAPAANPGQLVLNSWPTSGNVNFEYCNPSAGSITPAAATINWRVVR